MYYVVMPPMEALSCMYVSCMKNCVHILYTIYPDMTPMKTNRVTTTFPDLLETELYKRG